MQINILSITDLAYLMEVTSKCSNGFYKILILSFLEIYSLLTKLADISYF